MLHEAAARDVPRAALGVICAPWDTGALIARAEGVTWPGGRGLGCLRSRPSRTGAASDQGAGKMAGAMSGFATATGYARAAIPAAHTVRGRGSAGYAPHAAAGDGAFWADDRADIADALYRYAAGIDERDAGLLASSLDPDAVVDLSRAAAQVGVRFPALVRRDAVVTALMSVFGPLDTSHVLTNLRITVDGDTAVLRCYAQTHHYPPGDGPRPDRTGKALMMNRYTAELVRCDGHWRIRHLVVDNLWFDGDPGILAARL